MLAGDNLFTGEYLQHSDGDADEDPHEIPPNQQRLDRFLLPHSRSESHRNADSAEPGAFRNWMMCSCGRFQGLIAWYYLCTTDADDEQSPQGTDPDEPGLSPYTREERFNRRQETAASACKRSRSPAATDENEATGANIEEHVDLTLDRDAPVPKAKRARRKPSSRNEDARAAAAATSMQAIATSIARLVGMRIFQAICSFCGSVVIDLFGIPQEMRTPVRRLCRNPSS